ncbi:MAG: RNA polymerase sigma factor [Gammaproteobacteria bacterium]|nr:RNA polymerase sigma factor [Gammaproteobacteria bacterium]
MVRSLAMSYPGDARGTSTTNTARDSAAKVGAPPDDSDDALMARVQTGDQEAFARLLDRHLSAIHSYVYRMVGNTADAEDLAQETLLRSWSRAATWQPGRVQFTTWLHRIAHNLCIDEFRRRRPESTDQIDQIVDEAAHVTVAASDSIRRDAVNKALASLPERQRSALVLCQLHGWSNKEAATMMAISVTALESLIARARRTLKTTLRGFYENTTEDTGA